MMQRLCTAECTCTVLFALRTLTDRQQHAAAHIAVIGQRNERPCRSGATHSSFAAMDRAQVTKAVHALLRHAELEQRGKADLLEASTMLYMVIGMATIPVKGSAKPRPMCVRPCRPHCNAPRHPMLV